MSKLAGVRARNSSGSTVESLLWPVSEFTLVWYAVFEIRMVSSYQDLASSGGENLHS